ncbi:Transcription termination/antitermination protein NusG [Nymphon striatum]|nr:Transcription termination/antitermination protein NusG [Nymphon striatum]
MSDTTSLNRQTRRFAQKQGLLDEDGEPVRQKREPRGSSEPRTPPAQFLREVRKELKLVSNRETVRTMSQDLDAEAVEEPTDAPAAEATETDAAEGDAVEGAEAEVLSEDALIYEKLEDGEGELEDAPPAPKVISPYDRPGRWYVVHTQSGYEKKVKQNLEARTASMNMDGRIHEVVIPMEDVVEFRQGKKVVVQKKMFPGYLLVRCRLDDDSWFVIRNTPGVTGFVGQGSKPSPLPRREVETFLAVKDEGEGTVDAGQKKTRTRKLYEMGETVRVKEGPFADFSGEVIEINEDQLKVKVLVNIFGRETPVELEFAQVAKL